MPHFFPNIAFFPSITLKRNAQDKINNCLVVLNTVTQILAEFESVF